MTKKPNLKQLIDQTFSYIREPFLALQVNQGQLPRLVYANARLLELLACDNLEELNEYLDNQPEKMVVAQNVDAFRKIVSANSGKADHMTLTDRHGQEHIVNLEIRRAPLSESGLLICYVTPIELNRDVLTGLLDLRSFQEVGQTQTALLHGLGKSISVISFDLVGMKDYNNQYGFKKGDELLRFVASQLTRAFGENACTRSGEDRFYAYAVDFGLNAKLQEIIDEVRSRREIRIGVSGYDPDKLTFDEACNQSRVACESLADPYKSGIVFYDEKLDHKHRLQEHVLYHIDEAIAKGWIQVYYQPVVRTLSQKMCNVEALSRWIDPKYGIISPGDFVPVLEDANLSYKLDLFVLKQVCQMLDARLSQGLPVVPVSVNISRSDFNAVDPVAETAAVLDRYHLRHSLIAVEITETAVMQSREEISKAIARFHDLGFQVWMDDFGSGYSSLNALKDFHFDEIKIDMGFMRNLNDRSKKIVTKAISMAKSLGIHTLTEGVETEEQFHFLKDAGCERIQGYYFGKPQALDDLLAHLAFKEIPIEPPEEAQIFAKVGLIDLITPEPLAIYFYDGISFAPIYGNARFKDLLASAGLNDRLADSSVLHGLAEKAVRNNAKRVSTVISGGRYFQFSFKPVAQARKGCVLLTKIDGTISQKESQQLDLNKSLKNVLPVFNRIYDLDFASDQVRVVASDRVGESQGQTLSGLASAADFYGSECIHRDDLPRWHDFLSYRQIAGKLKAQKRNWLTENFRTKVSGELYNWGEYTLVQINDAEFMLLVKVDSREDERLKVSLLEEMYMSSRRGLDTSIDNVEYEVWKTLQHESSLKFFWKDTQRRFVGVSRAFLQYYGFASQNDVLGKTDDQIGWHKDNGPFRDDELRVLQEGRPVINAQTTQVFNGITSHIMACKFPIFDHGQIVGLVGYFEDLDAALSSKERVFPGKISEADAMTSFLDGNGLAARLVQYDDYWKQNQQEYCVAWIEVADFDRMKIINGSVFANELIMICAKLINEHLAKRNLVARMRGAAFAIATNTLSKEELAAETAEIKQAIEKVSDINGVHCQLSVRTGLAQASEASYSQEAVQLAVDRAWADEREKEEDQNPVSEFNEYLDLPLPFVIAKPVFNAYGDKVEDAILVFANEQFCERLGVSRHALLGKRYAQLYGEREEWLKLLAPALWGKPVTGGCYNRALRAWTNYYSKAAVLPGCTVTIFEPVTQSGNESALKTAVTDEECFRVTHLLFNGHQFYHNIKDALGEIGEVAGASHVEVIRTDRHSFSVDYEWSKQGDGLLGDDAEELEYGFIQPLEDQAQKQGYVLLHNVSKLAEGNGSFQKQAEFLHKKGIKRLLAVPIYDDDHNLSGYLLATDWQKSGHLDLIRLMRLLTGPFQQKLKEIDRRIGQNEFSNRDDDN